MMDNLLQICFKGTFEKLEIAIKVSVATGYIYSDLSRCFVYLCKVHLQDFSSDFPVSNKHSLSGTKPPDQSQIVKLKSNMPPHPVYLNVLCEVISSQVRELANCPPCLHSFVNFFISQHHHDKRLLEILLCHWSGSAIVGIS